MTTYTAPLRLGEGQGEGDPPRRKAPLSLSETERGLRPINLSTEEGPPNNRHPDENRRLTNFLKGKGL